MIKITEIDLRTEEEKKTDYEILEFELRKILEESISNEEDDEIKYIERLEYDLRKYIQYSMGLEKAILERLPFEKRSQAFLEMSNSLKNPYRTNDKIENILLSLEKGLDL